MAVAGTVLNNKNWARNLYGFHQLLGLTVPIPDPTSIDPATGKPTKMLVHITEKQSTELADAIYELLLEYPELAKWFSGKTSASTALLITAGTIYGPKFMLLAMMMKAAKAQRAGQGEVRAADVLNPDNVAPAPNGAAGGKYRYQ